AVSLTDDVLDLDAALREGAREHAHDRANPLHSLWQGGARWIMIQETFGEVVRKLRRVPADEVTLVEAPDQGLVGFDGHRRLLHVTGGVAVPPAGLSFFFLAGAVRDCSGGTCASTSSPHNHIPTRRSRSWRCASRLHSRSRAATASV